MPKFSQVTQKDAIALILWGVQVILFILVDTNRKKLSEKSIKYADEFNEYILGL